MHSAIFGFVLGVFSFNIWTLSEKMKMEMYDAGAVKQIYADLKAQPEEKRKEWIEKLPEKKVPVYTGNEYAEEMLYNKIFQEYRQVNRYDKYLEEIKEKSASMSSAIFSNEGTFAYRNAQITPDAYEKLKGLKLKSDVSDGVIFATEAEFTDLCIVFMLAVTVYFLVLDEKKNKLYPLLRSCYRGRGSVIGAKLTVAACVTALLVLLFYGVDYLYAWQKYGFGDLSRPIQSVTTMYESPYMMSVGMFYFISDRQDGSLLCDHIRNDMDCSKIRDTVRRNDRNRSGRNCRVYAVCISSVGVLCGRVQIR